MKKLANALASNPAWRFVSYTSATPTIATVTPSTGAEKDEVVIAGTNCKDVRKVLFGATEATFWTVDSDTQITARVPAGTGTVDVVVQTAGGTATKTNGFTYGSAAPTLTSSNYTQGDTAGGGQAIVLTGTGFTGVTGAGGVTFLGTNATSYTVDSDTQITAVLPAHAAGTGNIVVTHPTNGASNGLAFEYWDPTQITGVDVVLDANVGVTLTGVNEVQSWADRLASVAFTQAAAVRPVLTASVFGTMPSLRFTQNNWLTAAAIRALASGTSIFFVAKWTSTDTVVDFAPNLNAPLTLVGETGGSAWFGLGASGGALHYQAYDAGGGASYGTIRGSGLNDGTARLLGVTHDAATGDRKLYVGTAQQGATDTPATYSTGFQTYDTIGAGYTGNDGFDGDVGAVVVANGVIASGDFTKLDKWSKQRWGTP